MKISDIIKERDTTPSAEEWVGKLKKLETEVTAEMKLNLIKSAQTICPEFKITENLKPTLYMLCKYFLGIEGDLDLNKGIFLVGKFGVGKTTIMMAFRRWLADNWSQNHQRGNGFMATSIEEIIQDYKMAGNLDKWVDNSNDTFKPGP